MPKFSSRIPLVSHPSSHQLCSFPVPDEETHPHIMVGPLPCLIVGIMGTGLWAVSFFCVFYFTVVHYFVLVFYVKSQQNIMICDCDWGDSGQGLSCNRWVAGLNLHSVCLSRCVPGQDTSLALPADGGQSARFRRLCGSLTSVSVPQGSCGYKVAYHSVCECVYEWVDE
ncbi:hypothetical protein CHARACLAT_008499 [Characodon lateralis]|uniref:Uncharacterized protein n=1 Tax=Characodon lateralis TaxID=208331 RepID=A0ABU7ET40_9TELE|nr:hypothetical protein [Characodon lateralis]